MKLISCYIENFGNMKQRSFDFEKGLTSLCENNGYGKTTLAAFLKAMFYGLKQTRASDKELGERARFYPFEGGKFGGTVTIEKGGVIYKIERFFGKKSATEDTLTVYADGEIQPYTDDIGKEFFGLDEQSFLRTVFLNSSDTESGATGDISRMLNGFVDDADFDGAKKILEKQLKEYKAGRGRGGKIDEIHDEILNLKATIENKEKINGELSRKYADRRTLAGEIAQLEAKQTASRDANLVLQKWRTYDGFAADAAAEREKRDNLLNKYAEGIPEESEAAELKRCAAALDIANERMISATFSTEKEQRLEELSARFSAGVPTDEEIASANGTAADVIKLEAEIANYEDLIKDGSVKFPTGVPAEEEVKKYNDKLISLREKKNKQAPNGSLSKKIAYVLSAVAVVALGVGAGLMFVKMWLYGGILLGIGGVVALAGIFTYFTGQINSMREAVPTAVNSELENEIRSFLARYGYYSDGGIEVDFNNLSRDLELYNIVLAEHDKYAKLIEEKRAEADGAKARVLSFLNGYNFTGENAQADLTRLGTTVAEYASLKAEKEDFAKRTEAGKAEIEEYTRTVNNILSKYSIEGGEDLGALAAEIERDRNEYDRLADNTIRLEKRADDYKAENDLKERPEFGEEDTLSIDASLSKKRDELSLLDREIADDEGAVERLAELREELETAQEEELVLRKKYDILVRTLTLLEQAEQNLKDRYVSPVKNSFLNYSGPLETVLGERVSFDKDFKVRFERGGELRSDTHLSAGQKSLCALCLRLALIDNMYKGDKPFIIMDDPFVHLDNAHMHRAEVLLKELAKSKQIIYFCCHESRQVR